MLRGGISYEPSISSMFSYLLERGDSFVEGFRPVLAVSNNQYIDRSNLSPVITLIGDSIVEVVQGASYTDLGVTASDYEDGDITSSVIKTGTKI